ncbi:chemotaxis protein CheR [Bacillus pseudomycoides]|nr:chemotaxis protein CheR [Bacillus pseudomycoides]
MTLLEQDYTYFITQFKQHFNIDISLYKQDRMKRRIDSFILRRGHENYSQFIRELQSNPHLFAVFIDHLTINVSEFYRNRERWDALATKVLPKLIQQNNAKLKLWSAACAAGEEPYTLSIILSQILSKYRFEILATDLDPNILEKAKCGTYYDRSLKEVPSEIKQAYFTKKDEVYHIQPEIKQPISFKQHDLLLQSFDTNFDLIICRNVMIYFTEEARAQIYEKFSRSLKKGGVLFVGSTEQILTPERYNLQRFDTFFYEKI